MVWRGSTWLAAVMSHEVSSVVDLLVDARPRSGSNRLRRRLAVIVHQTTLATDMARADAPNMAGATERATSVAPAAKMPSSVTTTDMPACALTAVSATLSRGDGRRGKHTTEETT